MPERRIVDIESFARSLRFFGPVDVNAVPDGSQVQVWVCATISKIKKSDIAKLHDLEEHLLGASVSHTRFRAVSNLIFTEHEALYKIWFEEYGNTEENKQLESVNRQHVEKLTIDDLSFYTLFPGRLQKSNAELLPLKKWCFKSVDDHFEFEIPVEHKSEKYSLYLSTISLVGHIRKHVVTMAGPQYYALKTHLTRVHQNILVKKTHSLVFIKRQFAGRSVYFFVLYGQPQSLNKCYRDVVFKHFNAVNSDFHKSVTTHQFEQWLVCMMSVDTYSEYRAKLRLKENLIDPGQVALQESFFKHNPFYTVNHMIDQVAARRIVHVLTSQMKPEYVPSQQAMGYIERAVDLMQKNQDIKDAKGLNDIHLVKKDDVIVEAILLYHLFEVMKLALRVGQHCHGSTYDSATLIRAMYSISKDVVWPRIGAGLEYDECHASISIVSANYITRLFSLDDDVPPAFLLEKFNELKSNRALGFSLQQRIIGYILRLSIVLNDLCCHLSLAEIFADTRLSSLGYELDFDKEFEQILATVKAEKEQRDLARSEDFVSIFTKTAQSLRFVCVDLKTTYGQSVSVWVSYIRVFDSAYWLLFKKKLVETVLGSRTFGSHFSYVNIDGKNAFIYTTIPQLTNHPYFESRKEASREGYESRIKDLIDKKILTFDVLYPCPKPKRDASYASIIELPFRFEKNKFIVDVKPDQFKHATNRLSQLVPGHVDRNNEYQFMLTPTQFDFYQSATLALRLNLAGISLENYALIFSQQIIEKQTMYVVLLQGLMHSIERKVMGIVDQLNALVPELGEQLIVDKSRRSQILCFLKKESHDKYLSAFHQKHKDKLYCDPGMDQRVSNFLLKHKAYHLFPTCLIGKSITLPMFLNDLQQSDAKLSMPARALMVIAYGNRALTTSQLGYESAIRQLYNCVSRTDLRRGDSGGALISASRAVAFSEIINYALLIGSRLFGDKFDMHQLLLHLWDRRISMMGSANQISILHFQDDGQRLYFSVDELGYKFILFSLKDDESQSFANIYDRFRKSVSSISGHSLEGRIVTNIYLLSMLVADYLTILHHRVQLQPPQACLDEDVSQAHSVVSAAMDTVEDAPLSECSLYDNEFIAALALNAPTTLIDMVTHWQAKHLIVADSKIAMPETHMSPPGLGAGLFLYGGSEGVQVSQGTAITWFNGRVLFRDDLPEDPAIKTRCRAFSTTSVGRAGRVICHQVGDNGPYAYFANHGYKATQFSFKVLISHDGLEYAVVLVANKNIHLAPFQAVEVLVDYTARCAEEIHDIPNAGRGLRDAGIFNIKDQSLTGLKYVPGSVDPAGWLKAQLDAAHSATDDIVVESVVAECRASTVPGLFGVRGAATKRDAAAAALPPLPSPHGSKRATP